MHDSSTVTGFMALRANGWSLAKISKELNVSKATLWAWDNKHQTEIHFLKHLQLERLQEKFLPSYEEELSQLHRYLGRIEAALEKQDYSQMGPEFLLQMSLSLRSRLGKMREQVPLRTIQPNTPLEPLPLTGCISRQGVQQFRAEYSSGEFNPDDDSELQPASASQPATSPPDQSAGVPAEPKPIIVLPQPDAAPRQSNGHIRGNGNGNGKPHLNGNGKPHLHGAEHPSASAARVHPGSSMVEAPQENRTFPNETPRGSEMQTLNANHLHR